MMMQYSLHLTSDLETKICFVGSLFFTWCAEVEAKDKHTCVFISDMAEERTRREVS